jgi:Bacteriophage tail sheath protein
MAVQVSYPGVYIDEIPSAQHSIPQIPLSITAFMGNAIKGPINTPIRIKNQSDFNRTFGGLWEKSPLSYAISQYFTNGGADSYVVRVVAANAAIANAELACPGKMVLLPNIDSDVIGAAGDDGLPLLAAIDVGGSSTSFNLTVTFNTNNVTTYTNLNTIPGNPNNIHTRLSVQKDAGVNVMPNTSWPVIAVPIVKVYERKDMDAKTGEIKVESATATNLLHLQVAEQERDGFVSVDVIASIDDPTGEFDLKIITDYGNCTRYYSGCTLIEGASNSVAEILGKKRAAYVKLSESLPNSVPQTSPAISVTVTNGNPYEEMVFAVNSDLILDVNTDIIKSITAQNNVSVEIKASTSEPDNPAMFDVLVKDGVGGFEYPDLTLSTIESELSADNNAAVIAYGPLPPSAPLASSASKTLSSITSPSSTFKVIPEQLTLTLKPLPMQTIVSGVIIANTSDTKAQYVLKLEATGMAAESYVVQDNGVPSSDADMQAALMTAMKNSKIVSTEVTATNPTPVLVASLTLPPDPANFTKPTVLAIVPTNDVSVSSSAELYLAINAANPGAWGDNICIQVSKPEPDQSQTTDVVAGNLNVLPSDLFNLTIHNRNTKEMEAYLNLTVTDSDNRVDTVLNNNSKLVHYNTDIQLPTMTPAANSAPASGQAVNWQDLNASTNGQMTGTPPSQRLVAQYYVLDGGNNGSNISQSNLSAALASFNTVLVPFSLMCVPPIGTMSYLQDSLWVNNNVSPLQTSALKYCADNRAMLIIDPSIKWNSAEKVAKVQLPTTTAEGALYYPFISVIDPLNVKRILNCAPSGAVAGVIARIDNSYGVWRAPAGEITPLAGITGLTHPVDQNTSATLNPLGINCLRNFPSIGNVIWGARTVMGADALQSEYKYIPVRRLTSYIETSLKIGLHFAVFEPNNESLWKNLTFIVTSFLQNLFEQGAFQGSTAKDSYFVKCDAETTTAQDINDGIVNVQVGIAPVKPAEFVVISLSQIAGQTS